MSSKQNDLYLEEVSEAEVELAMEEERLHDAEKDAQDALEWLALREKYHKSFPRLWIEVKDTISPKCPNSRD